MLIRATHKSKQPHSAAELAWRLRQHFGAEMTVTVCDEQWLTFSREFEDSDGDLTAGEMGTVELDQERITVRLEASTTPFVYSTFFCLTIGVLYLFGDPKAAPWLCGGYVVYNAAAPGLTMMRAHHLAWLLSRP